MSTFRRLAPLFALAALATGCAFNTTSWPTVRPGKSWELARCDQSACRVRVRNKGVVPVSLSFDSAGMRHWVSVLQPDSTIDSALGYREVLWVANAAQRSTKLKLETSGTVTDDGYCSKDPASAFYRYDCSW